MSTSPRPRGWTRSLHRVEGRPVLRWTGDRAWRSVSSGVLGGGLGTSRWVLNATVPTDFDDDEPAAYLARLAASVGLAPEAGVGLLTAVEVDTAAVTVARPGVTVSVTTGVGQHALWPAVEGAAVGERCRAGTVNAVAWLDRPATPEALVNGVITMTEAKTQAFLEAGIDGTGTCTDSVTLLCPIVADDGHRYPERWDGERRDGEPTRYLGTRSPVGQALAAATHAAVTTGLAQERAAFAASGD